MSVACVWVHSCACAAWRCRACPISRVFVIALRALQVRCVLSSGLHVSTAFCVLLALLCPCALCISGVLDCVCVLLRAGLLQLCVHVACDLALLRSWSSPSLAPRVVLCVCRLRPSVVQASVISLPCART